MRRHGFTLVELLIGLAMLALLLAIGVEGLFRFRDASILRGATRAARGQLADARMLAIGERRVVRLRISPAGELVLYDADDEIRSRTSLRSGPYALDSLRLRPKTLRFNSRGQASPGSLYLYRAGRGVRIVSNFLGRIRLERFRVE